MAPTELRTELLRICGSKAWVERVAQTFPHVTPAAALEAMDRVSWIKRRHTYRHPWLESTDSVYLSVSVPVHVRAQVWGALGRADYLEAFAAHPRIGDAAALRKVDGCLNP